jgi:serine protease Do
MKTLFSIFKRTNPFILSIALGSQFFFTPFVEGQPFPTKTNAGTIPSKVFFDFTDVADKSLPAVVSIKVEASQKKSRNFFFDDHEDDDTTGSLLEKFFGLPRRSQGGDNPELVVGQGSGFIVSSDGYILTNSHVVKDMSSITVQLNDGQEFPATVIGQDAYTDVALIKIDAKDLPFLRLGNSDTLKPGQWIVTIGSPFGLRASIIPGVVSAKGRNDLNLSRIEDYIQISAPINQGNSGGPLLNLDSEVMGMNTAIVANSWTGFSIPSNILKIVLDDLKNGGLPKHGFIGIALQPLTKDLAHSFGLDRVEGALVADVNRDSPAEKGGIQRGDIILAINSQPISTPGSLRNTVAMSKPGSKVTFTILRNNKKIDLPITVGAFPSEGLVAESSVETNHLGLEVENLTPELASRLGYQNMQGVVVSKVNSSSPVAWAGIKKSALILEVNKKPIANVEDFNVIVKQLEPGKPILMLIRQGDATRFLSIKIG